MSKKLKAIVRIPHVKCPVCQSVRPLNTTTNYLVDGREARDHICLDCRVPSFVFNINSELVLLPMKEFGY